MEKERLNEANRLNKLIEEHEKALCCFEYDANESINDMRESEGLEKLPPEYKSTNPKLIIEFDELDEDWYRRQLPIPMVLSDVLVDTIKVAIKENLSKLKSEFEKL
ncbi:hypothetical protein [Parabacteroides leei]|uniref:hypothetical protein n=1 Tax=Parabacteroides leei TaxID=2939491 RepID=UPI00189C3068|nr:hypothetical protein [Parabacteroides goldsteinii]